MSIEITKSLCNNLAQNLSQTYSLYLDDHISIS